MNFENRRKKELVSEDLSPKKEKESFVFERQREIMERAKFERAQYVKDILVSRTADLATNFIPVAGAAKMMIEAAIGKTSSKTKLTRRERIDYAIIAGGTAVAYALVFSGMPQEGGMAQGAVGVFGKIEFGPMVVKEAAEFAREKFPAVAPVLDAVWDFMGKKKEAAKRIGEEALRTLEHMDTRHAFL